MTDKLPKYTKDNVKPGDVFKNNFTGTIGEVLYCGDAAVFMKVLKDNRLNSRYEAYQGTEFTVSYGGLAGFIKQKRIQRATPKYVPVFKGGNDMIYIDFSTYEKGEKERWDKDTSLIDWIEINYERKVD